MKYLFYINFSNKKCYNAAIQKYYQNAIDWNARNITHKVHLIWICRITLYMTYLITNMPQNDLKSSIHKI